MPTSYIIAVNSLTYHCMNEESYSILLGFCVIFTYTQKIKKILKGLNWYNNSNAYFYF